MALQKLKNHLKAAGGGQEVLAFLVNGKRGLNVQ